MIICKTSKTAIQLHPEKKKKAKIKRCLLKTKIRRLSVEKLASLRKVTTLRVLEMGKSKLYHSSDIYGLPQHHM